MHLNKNLYISNDTTHEPQIMRQTLSYDWDTNINNRNTFFSGKRYSVKEDMRENESRNLVEENGGIQSE